MPRKGSLFPTDYTLFDRNRMGCVLRAACTQHPFQRTIPDSSSFRFDSEFPIYPTDSASFRFPEFPVRFMSLRYSAYDSRILPAPSLRLLCHYPFPALHLRFASAFPCAFLISAYSGFPHFPYLAFPDFPYSTVYLVYKPVAKYLVDRLNINMDKPSC